MTLVIYKLIAAVLIFLVSIVIAIYPLKKKHAPAHSESAELGEALAKKIPSRTSETTIFKSLGMAVEDIAAAMLVYRKAVAN